MDNTLAKHSFTDLLSASLMDKYEVYIESKWYKGQRFLILDRNTGIIAYEDNWSSDYEDMFRYAALYKAAREGAKTNVRIAIERHEARQQNLTMNITHANHQID
jgi:hypothetical protein